ncbi:hypothetical protein KFE80_13005 [bacterium SCSIO 12696]|nr:hypothetical protein KFE80_13005 [bacterium SCSIO 12696]
MLPYITEVTVSSWLANYDLTGWALILMVPYFGLVHPLLEQIHWAPLRRSTPLAHGMFSGYHLLVLYTLLPINWLLAAFIVLVLASIFWKRIAAHQNGLAIPYCSHALADLGIVGTACLLVHV